ncbi:histidine phosphatase family protein [Lysobacter enzymogenes]|uniref:Histidine phosphatase family protein n=1 Tax=Lysobacter enzymogenes TaxID=69 RepID=A0A3N2RFS5_LYSEN|nr:histidine phosphatase family protein [Lysobacter enzymogenes]ROU06302.1 histidine phosphatase family protein [Lysobacter enzymogenes]
MTTTLHLIRHGQAAFGAADYDRLSDLGRQQSRLLGAALAPLAGEGDLAICGGMRRHRETAEECLAAMSARDAPPAAAQAGASRAGGRGSGVGLPICDERWNEFDHVQILARHRPEYADHDRLSADLRAQSDPHRAFQTLFAAAMQRWAGGEFDGDYDEPWPAFRARCGAALQAAAAQAGGARNVWIFTSGGPIAAVVQSLLDAPDAQALRLSWTLVNASHTQVHAARGGLRLSTFNGHAHLHVREGLITYR